LKRLLDSVGKNKQLLHSIGGLYEVGRRARDMSDEDRWRIGGEKLQAAKACVQALAGLAELRRF
jgi:hypothetical protein